LTNNVALVNGFLKFFEDLVEVGFVLGFFSRFQKLNLTLSQSTELCLYCVVPSSPNHRRLSGFCFSSETNKTFSNFINQILFTVLNATN